MVNNLVRYSLSREEFDYCCQAYVKVQRLEYVRAKRKRLCGLKLPPYLNYTKGVRFRNTIQSYNEIIINGKILRVKLISNCLNLIITSADFSQAHKSKRMYNNNLSSKSILKQNKENGFNTPKRSVNFSKTYRISPIFPVTKNYESMYKEYLQSFQMNGACETTEVASATAAVTEKKQLENLPTEPSVENEKPIENEQPIENAKSVPESTENEKLTEIKNEKLEDEDDKNIDNETTPNENEKPDEKENIIPAENETIRSAGNKNEKFIENIIKENDDDDDELEKLKENIKKEKDDDDEDFDEEDMEIEELEDEEITPKRKRGRPKGSVNRLPEVNFVIRKPTIPITPVIVESDTPKRKRGWPRGVPRKNYHNSEYAKQVAAERKIRELLLQQQQQQQQYIPYERRRGRPRKNFSFQAIVSDIKTVTLPSDLWSAHVSVTSKRSQVCFTRVVQTVSSSVPVECDRSVKFNGTVEYLVRINNREVHLVGAPPVVSSVRDIEILLQIINEITINDPVLEYLNR